MWSFFNVEVDADAIAKLTFSRPPVNAMTEDVYQELGEVSRSLTDREDVGAVILCAPPDNRAWCGGADLKQLQNRIGDDRAKRYALANAALEAFYNIDRPVIAAMNGNTIGVGMVWASLCDMRIGAAEAWHSLPEVQHGLGAGLAGFFNRLGMPEALIREMVFTGDRYSGLDLQSSGFFNKVVPRDEVVNEAFALARRMAKFKRTPLRITKAMANEAEQGRWLENYRKFQQLAIKLSEQPGSTDDIKRFLAQKDSSGTVS